MKNPKITLDEIGIIKKAQAGDQLAFSKLFKRYKGFVESVLYQYIKDKDESKDIANIVFLKVYNKLSTFTAYESFGGWLRIIANRTAIDYLRRVKEENNLSDQEDRLSSQETVASAEDDLINRMMYEGLVAEFNKLSPTTCKVCQLFYVEGLTVEQISKNLRIPTGTIKSMLCRTRRKLKQHLKF